MGFRFCYNRKTTNSKNLTLKFNGKVEGNIPRGSCFQCTNEWKWVKKNLKKIIDLKGLKKLKLKKLIQNIISPNHSNKSWTTKQYDQSVMCDTAQNLDQMLQLSNS